MCFKEYWIPVRWMDCTQSPQKREGIAVSLTLLSYSLPFLSVSPPLSNHNPVQRYTALKMKYVLQVCKCITRVRRRKRVEPILLAQSKHCLWQRNTCSGFAAVSHWGFFHISLSRPLARSLAACLSLPLQFPWLVGDIVSTALVSTLQLISQGHRHRVPCILFGMNY